MEFRRFGPPGTGKTTDLARQVRLAVEKHGPESVIVASFTKAAAREIASRDLPVEDTRVGTLHSLCYRAMGRPPLAETRKGFKAWNEWVAERKLPAFFAIDDGKHDRDPANPYEDCYELNGSREGESGNSLLRVCHRLRAKLTPLVKTEWLRAKGAIAIRAFKFHEAWSEFKHETGMIDFTDMVEHGLFMSPPHGATIGFFDEVQDFSALELSVVRHWEKSLEYTVLTGDDDQAIYGFRGATPDAFLDPQVPDAQKQILKHSYRLPRAVKGAADAWIKLLSRREPKDYSARDARGETNIEYAVNWKRPEPFVNAIDADVRAGKTVMVLALCSYLLNNTIAVLKKEGIPFHNAYRKENGRWNPLRGGGQRILAYLRPTFETFGNDCRLWTWTELWSWLEFVDAKTSELTPGGKTAAEKMAKDPGRRDQVLTREDAALIFGGTSRFERWVRGDLMLLVRHVTNPDKMQKLDYAVEVCTRRGPKGIIEEPKVTVGSIHSVKGGQADCVYLWPDISRAASEEMAEEGEDSLRRCFYVGMTRAREKLVVAHPYSRRLSMPVWEFV